MASNKLSRQGDKNQEGGSIIKGATTVYCNNKPVGVHLSEMSTHAPYGSPHSSSWTLEGSPNVYVENKPVLRVNTPTSCGHKIIEGSGNVFVS